MSFATIGKIGMALVTTLIHQAAFAQHLSDLNAIAERLKSDPRVLVVLKAIKDGYYPAPDLNAAVRRCIVAASLISGAPLRLQGDACLRQMVGGLDPLSAYMSEEELQRLLYSPGDGSIGLALKQSDLGAEVVSVIDESPGAKADISVGTLIVAIDGKPTALMSLLEVTSALRGPEGSVVSLELSAAESPKVVRRELRRERIRQTSISARVMDGQLGYVRVTQLGASLANELAEALHLLLTLQLQPVKGIIVDMRDCPGGLMHAAIALAAVFLPDDAVVMATASRIEGELTYRARQSDASSKSFDSGPIFSDKALRAAAQKIPLVVLVNHGTASGAEAVAAALQDTGRAHIIGQTTAGIGSVQTVLPMNGHGAIKLTTSVMRSASGRSWNEQGVRPDFPMSQAPRARQGGKAGSDPWIDCAAERLAKR